MLTQGQLAEKIGVTKALLDSWERGLCKPNFESYDKLCSFFDLYQKEREKVTGNRLREFRESLGVSKKQLAAFLGVSQVTIGNWECLRNKPDFGSQKKLSEMLKKPLKLKASIPQKPCAICGSILPRNAKKICSDACRREAKLKKKIRPKLERAVFVERVKAGMRKAKAAGKRIGRPKAVVDVDNIISLREQGFSFQAISDRVKYLDSKGRIRPVSKGNVHRIIKVHGPVNITLSS